MKKKFSMLSLTLLQTLGIELLLARAKSVQTTSEFHSSGVWLRYEEKLKKYDYYKGLIEGSREYKALEERARVYFQSTVASELERSIEDQAIDDIQTLMSQMSDTPLMLEEESLPDDGEHYTYPLQCPHVLL